MERDNKDNYSKIFWELFIYKSITTFLSIIAYTIFILFQNKYNIIYIILSLNILASILDISWFFQGLEEYKLITIKNIFIKIFFTISIFIFVKNSNDLNLYIILNSAALLFSSLALWVNLPKFIKKVPMQELKIFRHTKNTLIYFLPQIATQIYTMVDKTMLGIMTGSEMENGYYEQAYKIVTISLTVITSLNTVMAPRMSYLYKTQNHSEIQGRLMKSLKFSCFLGIPMMFGLAAISNTFVPWFFGKGYEKVSILLPIFSPIILIIALSNCLGGQCLTPCGKRGKSAIALWIGAILNFIVNLILIPKLGSIGAVIASILAEFIIVILYFYLARKYISLKEFFNGEWKCLVAGIIMFMVVFLLSKIVSISIINTFIEISIGAIVYIIFLLLLKEEFIMQLLEGVKRYGKKFFTKRRKNM